MFKDKIGPLFLVVGVACYVGSCGSNDKTGGGPSGSGGVSATGGSGGVSATGGKGGASATGGGGASATGGTTATGGASAAGGTAGTTLTLAQACKKNCAIASGLATCSTTTDVCEQSCLTTFINTSNVNPDLGRQYTAMMVCVATNPKFASPADFVCAKPDRALNKWSPGPDSDCEQLICDWNCMDGTTGNMDPFVDIRCSCSSV
jgi:hypothetical protein